VPGTGKTFRIVLRIQMPILADDTYVKEVMGLATLQEFDETGMFFTPSY
jgi:hypothetical protein